jgi:hypothetical protein
MNIDFERVVRVIPSPSDSYETDQRKNALPRFDPMQSREGGDRCRRRGTLARFAAALLLATCVSAPLTAAWAQEE